MSEKNYPIMEKQGNKIIIKSPCREYTFENSILPISVVSKGKEILSAPFRIVCSANGEEEIFEPAQTFTVNYKEDACSIAATMQSKVLFVNTNVSVEEDGCAFVDMGIMPRGLTVPEMFGVVPRVFHKRVINHLWLEVPFKKECASLYQVPAMTHLYGDIPYRDTSKGEPWQISWSGATPKDGFTSEFTSQILLANEEVGMGLIFYNNQDWNYADETKAFEVIENGDEYVLRIHLLDGVPKKWEEKANTDGSMWLNPIQFRFAFCAIPYRELEPAPFKQKPFHVDCFKKLDNDYEDFFTAPVVEGSDEIGFDRLKRLGVNVLYIHEKWNDMQNSPILTDKTRARAKLIVEECHKRGIKVIPYFGYEISSLSPLYGKYGEAFMQKNTPNDNCGGAWNRWPGQRALRVCLNSGWADIFIEGVKKVVEEFNFDGIYLDTTMWPKPCANILHGCGYTDTEGNVHPTYSHDGIRKVFRELYKFVKARGGIMNNHGSGVMNLVALNYCTSVWEGESFQGPLLHGKLTKMPEGHLRMMFSSEHYGMPVYSLCYSNDPVWTYGNAIATQLLHNSMPKPVDIGAPLEETSKVWRIYDSFPIAESKWCPYYTDNGVKTSDERVKVSYYEAGNELLAVVSGCEANINSDVVVDFASLGACEIIDADSGETLGKNSFTRHFDGFEYILVKVSK
ncbi:MAG: hypothetical protein IJE01_05225 [Clostridia bacterium]|nr:hypothetical protein [Clostridia bacterium]